MDFFIADPPSTSRAESSSSSTSGRRPLCTLQSAARQQLTITLPSLDVDSPLFPAEVRTAIREFKRPTDQYRVIMVERIVDYCRENIAGFQRSSCQDVAKKIVELYPDSFKDVLPVSSHGSDSLIKQILIRYDNEKRPAKPLATEKQAPASKEAYGCHMFEPALPDQATIESLTRKRDELKTMHRMSKKDWDWKTIKRKMEETYYLQRKDILSSLPPKEPASKRRKKGSNENEATVDDVQVYSTLSMVQIKESWPFLFTSQGINQHFKTLTGVNFHEKFTEYIRNNAVNIIDFLSSQNEDMLKLKRRMERAERGGCGSAKTVALLLMTMQHFGDQQTSLFKLVEVNRFSKLTRVLDDMHPSQFIN